MKTSILLTYALCLMTPGCSLITVPVTTAGKIVTTTVSTTGKVVAAPFEAVGGHDKDEKELKKEEKARRKAMAEED
jgi:hypothetical protein